MFCGNCGSEIQESLGICSQCGKSSKGDNTYPLTNFTAKSFNVLFEVTLWVILIGGIVIGGTIGSQIGRLIRQDLTFLGIIIGGTVSFIQIVLIGGLVSLFIKLVNNTNEIRTGAPKNLKSKGGQ